ncbi:MAG TPA: YceI family protein [Hanamia sp.]
MKKNYKQFFTLLAFCTVAFNPILHSQTIYKINESKDIDMKLSGTSTLHKWNMDTKTFSGEAKFVFNPANENKLTSITSLNFSLAVKDLKSGDRGLDKNAGKALKSDTYKDILYKLTSAKVVPVANNKYLLKTQGSLTIAGITKQVAMDVNCTVNEDASINCSGSYKLEMTDYKVKPPTFMLGAMKTGDAITLDYTLVYKK